MTLAAVGVERYALHGFGLRISGEPRVVEAIDTRLGMLPRTGGNPAADLDFEFASVSEDGPRADCRDGELRSLFRHPRGGVDYDPIDDRLYLHADEHLRAVCEPEAGRMRVVFSHLLEGDLWLLAHPFLTAGLLESLKRRGLFNLHAAGLSRGGRGLLIAGASGSGKSTLSVGLALAGFDFLGDDTLFLSETAGSLRAYAFPDEVDVTETTLGFFPSLRHLREAPRRPGWPKWSFRADTVLGASRATACEPAALVFPRVTGATHTRIEPMRPQEALIELIENVLVTEHRSAQAHLGVLAQLTASIPCYRVWSGSDMGELVQMVGDLVA